VAAFVPGRHQNIIEPQSLAGGGVVVIDSSLVRRSVVNDIDKLTVGEKILQLHLAIMPIIGRTTRRNSTVRGFDIGQSAAVDTIVPFALIADALTSRVPLEPNRLEDRTALKVAINVANDEGVENSGIWIVYA
jgi:hypothetical protein